MVCRKYFEGAGPLLGMLACQLISTGMQILARVILSEGMFIYALVTYRHIFAALCVAPFAFYFERGIRAKVTLLVLFWVFLNSLTGIAMGSGLYYYGLRDTTATYATSLLNLMPITTFVISVLARVEILNLKTRKGKIKVIGVLLSMAGALTISLYKGRAFHIGSHQNHYGTLLVVEKMKQHWTRGTILLVGSCLSYALWFLVQVKLLRLFPYKYWVTMLTCISASIQGAVIGLCMDRSKSSWKLGWNLQLLAIVYSGALASAAAFYLTSWAVSSKGPTYPGMFNPLALMFVALIEFLILGEDLALGSIIGMVVIVVGLYCFLWGSKTQKNTDAPLPKSASTNEEAKREASVESGGSQLTTTVVATALPVSHGSAKPGGTQLTATIVPITSLVSHGSDDEHYTGP